MFKTILTIAAVSFIIPATYAQAEADSLEVITGQRRTIELELQPWTLTNNAAGLSRIAITDNGVAYAGVQRSVGRYHRPQEGDALNSFFFSADRYTRLGKYLHLYGKFDMDLGREYSRAWSDVKNTYSGNPYIYGSARKGDYDSQTFNIQAKASTIELGRFTYGFELRYKVGDLSRLKDPRPRNIFADYSLIPSVTYRIGNKSTLGVDGYYRFNKHKLISITTVEPDKYIYYDFQGMENVILSSTSLFSRSYVARHWGADLQYTYRNKGSVWLTTIGLDAMKEKITGSERTSPGRYVAHTYSALSALRLQTPRILHSVTLEGRYIDGNADLYKQTQIQETDEDGNTSKTWVTTYSALIYRNYNTKASLSYKMYRTKENKDYQWYIGAGGEYYAFENTYLLPYSTRSISVIDATVDFGIGIWSRKEHNILLRGDVGMRFPSENKMELASETEVSQNVLVPDQLFFNSKNYGGNLRLTYYFPLRIGKQKQRGFAEMFGGAAFADYRDLQGNRTRRAHIGFSFGILTR